MSDSWYIKTRSGKRGPFSVEKLQQFVDAEVLLPNAGISETGEKWVAAKSVASLDFSRVSAEPAKDALDDRQRQIDALEQELHAKQAEWESRTAALDTTETELQSRQDALDDRQRQIDALEQELHAKQAEWESRTEALDTTETELQSRQDALDDRQRQIDALEQELHAKQAEWESRTEALETTETELQSREHDLQQQAESLSTQQQSIHSEIETLDHDRQALVDQREALSQQEAELETQRTALQSQREEMLQREQNLIAREEAIQQQLQQLDQRQQDAEQIREEADERNAEKKKLLAEFAARQESLSQREAELARREEELLRRELAIIGEEASTDEASSDHVSERKPKPKPQRVAAANVKRKSIRTEVVGAAVTTAPEISAASPQIADEVQEEIPTGEDDVDIAVAEVKSKKVWVRPSQHQEADLAEGQLSAFRRTVYESRFGPCSQYLEDDDEIKIDVSVHEPSGAREFTTMVTSGLSDYPIASSGGNQSVRAELLLYVTHDDALAIDTLRSSAKIPIKKQAGVSIGMTDTLNLGAGAPAGCPQTDSVLMLPVIESDSKPIPARELTGGSIQLFWLVTITKAERRLIESSGIHKFLSLMETNNHAVFFDLSRECFVKRKGWFR